MTFSGDIRAPLEGFTAPAIGGPGLCLVGTWGRPGRFANICRRAAGAAPGSPGRWSRAFASVRRPCYAAANASSKDRSMPILIFIVLVILIAQVGFWDTFSAILGGVAMIVLLVLLAIALVVLAGMMLLRRMR
jgi:hypothetical protein